MTRLQLLLCKLAEECNEVGKEALKCQQFGLWEEKKGTSTQNGEVLNQELDDLLTIVGMLNEEFGLGYVPDEEAITQKKIKVNKWAAYSKRLGELIT